MYEPVNSLVDDDDDEITSEIPYDPLSVSMEGTMGSLDNIDQPISELSLPITMHLIFFWVYVLGRIFYLSSHGYQYFK